MARVAKHPHLYGWLLLAILCFIQVPGHIVADTKTDLFLNPAHFLAGSLHAWTPIFTMGQMQNQAYGYLFPQGLFFLVVHYILPIWVGQRLWWLIVLGLGYSGFFKVASLYKTPGLTVFCAAFLYALSPHTIATLGAISSETWPAMLAPWILYFLMKPGAKWAGIPQSLFMVGCLGAVNATATLIALIPAGIFLVRRPLKLLLWGVGVGLLSIWWMGPLLILGKYSAPFTDYIESSYVTTRWLGVAEVLRGTTSWSPFVSTERLAGYSQATNAVWVIVLGLLALAALWGLKNLRSKYWWFLLGLGLVILVGSHHVIGLLDGPLVAFRNVHKFDLLVRLPLCLGIAMLRVPARDKVPVAGAKMGKPARLFAQALVLLVLASTAPAWAANLAPQGSYTAVPQYWKDASDWLNHNDHGRALLLPDSPFARQDWGWTRDEVLQSYADVPWATRDAIPLIDPEAIRALDGALATLATNSLNFENRIAGLERLGIGTLVIRHDLEDSTYGQLIPLAKANGYTVTTFGEVDIVQLPDAPGFTTTTEPLRVSGSGESLALLDALSSNLGYTPAEVSYQLTDENAEIITDTPALTGRNYGSIRNNSAGYVASLDEVPDIHNSVKDYATDVAPISVNMTGGSISASTAASDPGSLVGADNARALTAAVDGDPDTAWYPEPGYSGWLELHVDGGSIIRPVLNIRTTGSATNPKLASSKLLIMNGSTRQEVDPVAGKDTSITLDGGPTDTVRVYVPRGIGIAEINFAGRPIEREVTVNTTSNNVKAYLFQQLFAPTGILQRAFQVPAEMTLKVTLPVAETGTSEVTIDGQTYHSGEEVTLGAGVHHLSTSATWILLGNPITLTPGPAIYHPVVSYNTGLRYNGATPIRVDGGMVGFETTSTTGEGGLTFTADHQYRLCLLAGGIVFIVLMLIFGVLGWRSRHDATQESLLAEPQSSWILGAAVSLGAILIGYLGIGTYGAVAAVIGTALAWAIKKYWGAVPVTVLWWATGLVGFGFLERAPWPSAQYEAAVRLSSVALCFALGAIGVLVARQTRSSDLPPQE